jgi:phosphatidylglycerol:prolipoprotein diacylglycerol transferase
VNLGLYGVLAWLYRRKTFDGQVFATYLMAYGALRFLLEFFRGDYDVRYLGGWATSGHVVSVLVLATGAALYAWQRPGANPPSKP